MGKTLYHSELSKAGQVQITVKSEIQKSKYQGKPNYVVVAFNGEERTLNLENENCEGAFRGMNGRTITVIAEGRAETATIQGLGMRGSDVPPPQSRQQYQEQPREQYYEPQQEPPRQQQQQAPPPRQEAPPAEKPTPHYQSIHGATVGQSINIATRVLLEACPASEKLAYVRSHQFLTDTHEVASGIARLAMHMEKGNLTPVKR